MDLVVDYTLSISTISPSVLISIVPNPASKELLISLEGVNKAEATIFDVLGNKITSTLVDKSKKINVQNYKNGVYFINLLTSNNQEITKRLLLDIKKSIFVNMLYKHTIFNIACFKLVIINHLLFLQDPLPAWKLLRQLLR